MRKLFRDVGTGHIFCNVDDEELYRSVDNGEHWDKIAENDEFTWLVDANGRTHVLWPDKE